MRNLILNSIKSVSVYRSIHLQTSKRSLFTGLVTMEDLKENPYFEKYASKIASLSQDAPDEFTSRVNKLEEIKKSLPGGHAFSQPDEKPKMSAASYGHAPAKSLDSVMKIDLLKDKNGEEIKYLWIEHFKSKPGIFGSLAPEMYDKIQGRATQFPLFLFPLPRNKGYEFIVAQFSGQEIHFTSLINYQTHKENAPECLTITYFPDLKEEKNIVLMKGLYNKDFMSVEDAQFIANQVGLYYGGDDLKRLQLLETFHKSPEAFKHTELISQIENFDLESVK